MTPKHSVTVRGTVRVDLCFDAQAGKYFRLNIDIVAVYGRSRLSVTLYKPEYQGLRIIEVAESLTP